MVQFADRGFIVGIGETDEFAPRNFHRLANTVALAQAPRAADGANVRVEPAQLGCFFARAVGAVGGYALQQAEPVERPAGKISVRVGDSIYRP